MLLRKINAIISLLTTLFLLIHAITVSAWMLSRGNVRLFVPLAPWILAALMAVHAFIGIYFAVSANMSGDGRKTKSYPRLNRVAFFQRISGILLILFSALHIAGAVGFLKPPHIINAVFPPLFFAIALAHAAVSTDKAFITLGIGNARFIKAVGVIARVICAATFVVAVAGFYFYTW